MRERGEWVSEMSTVIIDVHYTGNELRAHIISGGGNGGQAILSDHCLPLDDPVTGEWTALLLRTDTSINNLNTRCPMHKRIYLRPPSLAVFQPETIASDQAESIPFPGGAVQTNWMSFNLINVGGWMDDNHELACHLPFETSTHTNWRKCKVFFLFSVSSFVRFPWNNFPVTIIVLVAVSYSQASKTVTNVITMAPSRYIASRSKRKKKRLAAVLKLQLNFVLRNGWKRWASHSDWLTDWLAASFVSTVTQNLCSLADCATNTDTISVRNHMVVVE